MAESTDDKRPLAGLILKKLAEGTMGVGFLLLSATVLIFAAQVFFYLKSGVVPKWALFGLISSALPIPFIQWLAYPLDWRGLHKIVAWIVLESPLALDALVLALVLFWGSTKITES